MTHYNRWFIEDRVVYVTYNGTVSIDELKLMIIDMVENYLNKGTPPVHLIVNVKKNDFFSHSLG